MEKVITVPVKVDDVMGLMVDLKKAGFCVVNIGSDPGHTFIYLDLSEEKDPVPIAESWVGKEPPSVDDREAWQKRAAEMAALPEVPKPVEEKRPSLLSRIYRKIMG